MRTILGMTSFFIGIGSADSENLLIPLAFLIIGFILIRKELLNGRKAKG